MRLYIIRHADPDYENNTITGFGHKEANALAKRLEKEQIDRIYCSKMQRAIDTMKYTLDRTGITPVMCDWMNEVAWEDTIKNYKNPWDLPGDKLLEQSANYQSGMLEDNPYFDGNAIAVDLKKRVEFFEECLFELGYLRKNRYFVEIKENHEKVAMFCHAGFGNAMISYLLNIPLTLQWAGFWMAPSAVTTILFSKRSNNIVVPKCISYGDISHLYESRLPVRPRGLIGDFT